MGGLSRVSGAKQEATTIRILSALLAGALSTAAFAAHSQEIAVGQWQARLQSDPRNPVVITDGPDGPEYLFKAVPGMRRANDRIAERSELSFQHKLPFGVAAEQRYSVRASAIPVKEPRLIIGQWHAARNRGWGPWLALLLTNKGNIELQVTVPPDRKARKGKSRRIVLHSEPFVPDQWYDLDLRFTAGMPPDSRLDAWLNGRRVASYRGALGYVGEPSAGYWKFGAYRATPGNQVIEVRYRNVALRVGDSGALSAVTGAAPKSLIAMRDAALIHSPNARR
ncbi:heparin lyase I family protein [Sphingomonas japonica]|uniref:heparin lyase I family protein n=1 Tax=Sphingomonas japonica TaxID=511662 RepID=UPI001ABA2B99